MDVNYLHHREGVERLRAAAALNANARRSHIALADAYRAEIVRQRRGFPGKDDRARG